MRKVNFLIISESYIYKTGLRFLLEELDNTGKIYFSEDLSQIGTSNADYIFLDPDLPLQMDVLQQIRSIKNDKWPILIVLIHHQKDKDRLPTGLFHYFLNLSQSKSEIIHSLHNITHNGLSDDKAINREEKLSEREKTILRHVALGFTNKEIAEKLFISMHTVITHRKNITRKLGIKTVSGLTIYAILNQLIDMNEAG